jgi:glucosylceramidase
VASEPTGLRPASIRGWRTALLALALLAACPPPATAAARADSTKVTVVQTTADLSQRLTRLPDVRLRSRAPRAASVIAVDDRRRYQRVSGFGAAMTDSAAWLLYAKLPPAARAAAMGRLFGPRGIRLGFVRVPIGASDFTRDGTPYTYADVPPGQSDPGLSAFSVTRDDAYVVPALRMMRAINPRVKILASPWSPPGWMKSNGSLDNLGNVAGLLRSAYRPFADYFVKFLRAYERRGLRVDAVTPQNEPGQQTAYPGLSWPEPDQARWIVSDLAPALRAAGLRTRIYGHDATWSGHADARSLASRPRVARAISGVAWHCYVGNPLSMTRLHTRAPRLDQIVTECSSGIAPGPAAQLLIASLRNWSSAVLLWNLALDRDGGPVQAPNSGCRSCTGVVTVDVAAGKVSYGRDYYELGQASAFIDPGARRIASNTFATYNSAVHNRGPSYATATIDNVAFENPDGSKVLLVFNNAARSRRFAVRWRGRSFEYSLAPQATATFVWDRPRRSR